MDRPEISIWYEGLAEPWIGSGHLEQLVREEGVSGLIWRPSSTASAIAEGSYDDPLAAQAGITPQSVANALLLREARWACDLLAPTFEESDGTGGLVIVPLDGPVESTAAVPERAEHMAQAIDRPNLVFSMPGTAEGAADVAELVLAGYRTDVRGAVTDDQIRRMDDAYRQAVRRRHARGHALGSVGMTIEMPVATLDAAFNAHLDAFSSQVDPNPPDESAVDQSWPGEGRALRSRLGIAYAQLCHAWHEQRYGSRAGKPFAPFKAAGAKPTRVRFSALSTTDPPKRYAPSLAAPDVVLTADSDSLRGVLSTRSVPISAPDIDEARALLDRLADIHQELEEILRDAYAAAVHPGSSEWGALLQAISERQRNLRSGRAESGAA